MNVQELIQQTLALQVRIQSYIAKGAGQSIGDGAKAQVCEFLRSYAGPKSAFLAEAQDTQGHDAYKVGQLTAILGSYAEYLKSGLATSVSVERKAQIDVVSDILGQAHILLENSEYHPAAAAVLVGASLEEFLRGWIEAENLSLGNAKPSIDAYCKVLRSADLISKQDAKDITSWGGLRNHAAHGEWEEVADRSRIRLMLEGVNLFMRQRSGV
jgi:hypothetical protein